MPGTEILEQIEIQLRNHSTGDLIPVYVDIFDNSLSRKWLPELNCIIQKEYHLEKNYCFLGWDRSARNLEYLCKRINETIFAINASHIDYTINDYFSPKNVVYPGTPSSDSNAGEIVHDKMNNLHRYFEDLQGQHGSISSYYNQADATTRWHIRQLNLLCHETETFALSARQGKKAPMWRRPSQLMCWLNAPRFELDTDDLELFGIDTLARPLGGVYVGVNKGVGKHHWEVYQDEGKYGYDVGDLTTTVLSGNTVAAADFDIEWANNPGEFEFMQKDLAGFRQWLIDNNIDPEDPTLTIGHPQIGQVDLQRSFGSDDYNSIWNTLETHLDVYSISTSTNSVKYEYHWSDADYAQQQIEIIGK